MASSPPNSATPRPDTRCDADFVGYQEALWDKEVRVSARQQRSFGPLWDVFLPSKVGRPLRQHLQRAQRVNATGVGPFSILRLARALDGCIAKRRRELPIEQKAEHRVDEI